METVFTYAWKRYHRRLYLIAGQKWRLPHFAGLHGHGSATEKTNGCIMTRALATCSNQGLKVYLVVINLKETCIVDTASFLVHVDDESYDLKLSGWSPQVRYAGFNLILVRYFSHETPRMSLEQNCSILVSSLCRVDHERVKVCRAGWDQMSGRCN